MCYFEFKCLSFATGAKRYEKKGEWLPKPCTNATGHAPWMSSSTTLLMLLSLSGEAFKVSTKIGSVYSNKRCWYSMFTPHLYTILYSVNSHGIHIVIVWHHCTSVHTHHIIHAMCAMLFNVWKFRGSNKTKCSKRANKLQHSTQEPANDCDDVDDGGDGDDEGRQFPSVPMWMQCDPRCECDSVAFHIANHAQFYVPPFGFIFVSLNRQRKSSLSSSSSSSLLLLVCGCFKCGPFTRHAHMH